MQRNKFKELKEDQEGWSLMGAEGGRWESEKKAGAKSRVAWPGAQGGVTHFSQLEL